MRRGFSIATKARRKMDARSDESQHFSTSVKGSISEPSSALLIELTLESVEVTETLDSSRAGCPGRS